MIEAIGKVAAVIFAPEPIKLLPATAPVKVAVVPTILPAKEVAVTVPLTCRAVLGVTVPMPTLWVALIRKASLPLVTKPIRLVPGL